MSELTDRLKNARIEVVRCAHDLRAAKAELTYDEVEVRADLIIQIDGDYKLLGPNETAQKNAIDYRLQDELRIRAGRQRVLNLQNALETAQAILDSILDERDERYYDLDCLRVVTIGGHE